MTEEVKLLFDNTPATEEQFDLFRRITVDQGIGMVTEAELEMDMLLDDTGRWVDFDESFTQTFSRVRIEVKVGDGDFAPLIDGPVVAQRMTMSAVPDRSTLTLVVHDDSVLLNQLDGTNVFEEMAASDIAEILFAEAGLQPQVDAAPDAGGSLERAVVQRGTAMQLLRDLARRHGMALRVDPGPAPGASIGVFAAIDLDGDDLPELLITGADRNLDEIAIEFDGLRPFAAAAAMVDAGTLNVLEAEATGSSQTTLGDEATHDLVAPARVLMARMRETASDLDAAVAAAADSASWAYTATGELDSAAYPAVLRPYATVPLAGAGPMSGRYLCVQVMHRIDDNAYRQQFTLRRNARSVTGGGGGLPGGVF
ncbi:hypothetical protein SAMN05421688_0861 [Poseidonocella pacifica]|uniref:Phage protein D n=1 Tax=Poseidonocella pacifica TaxID=871651 RepID=A0A1I0VPU7_9RHOB|nr:hypothetical protein [Poseidonocella pacifica]SFA78449.1 hypothetical protein SAMN05421688_0861 [Poseidonocella pacifica]